MTGPQRAVTVWPKLVDKRPGPSWPFAPNSIRWLGQTTTTQLEAGDPPVHRQGPGAACGSPGWSRWRIRGPAGQASPARTRQL